MSSNRVIGRDNTLPWRLPEDLRRFKRLTMGKPILMGRRTFESIGRPLPGRHNIVLTRQQGFAPAGVSVVPDWESAVAAASDAPELLVIGGEQLYVQALPHAQRIYLTEVHARIDGDAVFPVLEPGQWRELERESRPADAAHAYAMSFITLERIQQIR